MFDRSSGKGKTQIGMAKLILLPLIGPQERTNGDRKTQKKNGGFEETELVH